MGDPQHRRRGLDARSSRSRSPERDLRPSPRYKPKHLADVHASLPFGSRTLTKHDFESFRPMFSLYLDIQKRQVLEEMQELEVKGRWKSFIGKWNRGQLAEGWYDPQTLQKARDRSEPSTSDASITTGTQKLDGPRNATNSDSDDAIGPSPPVRQAWSRNRRLGPTIPDMEDLQLRRELEVENRVAQRGDLESARKLDRKEQKFALEELVPRAEAGTRERQLEKKKEVNEKMKSYRERSPGVADLPDSELMGGDDGSGSYKKQKADFERKKNERELRKEEFLRARQAQREERLEEYRVKEDATMAMLKALAKQNFGDRQ